MKVEGTYHDERLKKLKFVGFPLGNNTHTTRRSDNCERLWVSRTPKFSRPYCNSQRSTIRKEEQWKDHTVIVYQNQEAAKAAAATATEMTVAGLMMSDQEQSSSTQEHGIDAEVATVVKTGTERYWTDSMEELNEGEGMKEMVLTELSETGEVAGVAGTGKSDAKRSDAGEAGGGVRESREVHSKEAGEAGETFMRTQGERSARSELEAA